MKKHVAFFLLFFALFSFSAKAQTSFQKSLPFALDTTFIQSSPDGTAVYVAGTIRQNGQINMYLLRMDNAGTVQWMQEFSTNNMDLKMLSLVAVSDGALILLCDFHIVIRVSHSNSYLLKFGTNGNIVWNHQIGVSDLTQVFEIQKDDDEKIWLSGANLPKSPTDTGFYYLVKIRQDGTFLDSKKSQHHYFPNSTEEVYQVRNMIWNKYRATMSFVEDFEVPYNHSYIAAVNRGQYNIGNLSKTWVFDEKPLGIQVDGMQTVSKNIAFSGWTTPPANRLNGRDKHAIGLLGATDEDYAVVKITDTLLTILHSYNGDIIFYHPGDKTLTKYDTLLNPIWTKKFDNCSETDHFAGDIAIDGTIYTARNIDKKTVISHILPNGTLPNCTDFDKPSPLLLAEDPIDVRGLAATGYPDCSILSNDNIFNFTLTATKATDFCVKIDASFVVPDTVCLGTVVTPQKVDTTGGGQHFWINSAGNTSTPVPDFVFLEGTQTIFHTVQNNICMDTATHYVHVIRPPKISFGDTLVCGAATLSVNLIDANASHYFLNGQTTSPQFTLNQTGSYTIKIDNKACSVDKKVNVKIVNFAPPIPANDSIYCNNTPVPITLTGNFENIFWDNIAIKDTFFIRDAIKHTYRATYSLDKTCIAKGDLKILRKNCKTLSDALYIPNSFSPNGDGSNDVFKAYLTKNAEFHQINIFNRWGSLLFHAESVDTAWDGIYNGQALPPDVYVYWVEYKDLRTGGVEIVSGDITLIR